MNSKYTTADAIKLIRSDEPIFILRAKDNLTPLLLELYIEKLHAVNDKASATIIEQVLSDVNMWRSLHPERCQHPTVGPVLPLDVIQKQQLDEQNNPSQTEGEATKPLTKRQLAQSMQDQANIKALTSKAVSLEHYNIIWKSIKENKLFNDDTRITLWTPLKEQAAEHGVWYSKKVREFYTTQPELPDDLVESVNNWYTAIPTMESIESFHEAITLLWDHRLMRQTLLQPLIERATKVGLIVTLVEGKAVFSEKTE